MSQGIATAEVEVSTLGWVSHQLCCDLVPQVRIFLLCRRESSVRACVRSGPRRLMLEKTCSPAGGAVLGGTEPLRGGTSLEKVA